MDDLFDKWTVQLRKGALELMIMAALRRQERYAFELIGAIRDRSGLEMPEGTVYPLLIRLSKDGMIAAEWREGESGAPRKFYALTGDGQTMLERMIGGWKSLAGAVDAMIGGTK